MSNMHSSGGRGLTVAALLLGGLLLGAGLLFLVAAVQNSARLPVAVVLALLGGGLASWAGLRWRQARQLSADVLDDRILDLAAANNAELTLAQIVAGLDVPDDAVRATLGHMEAEGSCHQEQRQGRTLYVFPGLQQRKVVRLCAYCGSQYSVREPLQKCPNCGGALGVVKT